MSTLFVKHPPADQAGSIAYCNECNARYEQFLSDNSAPEPGAIWYIPREDKNGNWTVALFGPPWSWDGINTVPEPASCAALRVDAVVVETPEWPVFDE